MIFMLLVLGLIYLFQTTFLDDFYKRNKIKTIENISAEITDRLEDDDLNDVLESVSLSNEVCVRIVSDKFNVEGFNEESGCALKRLDYEIINQMANEVIENNGEKLFEDYHFNGPALENNDIYIFGKMTRYEGDHVLVLVSSMVTPITATISTIQSQYLIIALIVIAATILLALLLSKIILKPVKNINEEARNLPKGEYEGDNIKANNRELSELNNTLTKANDEILKADRAKKELLSNVSHDLRTPLTMIVGYGEMIRDIKEENNEENINVIIDEAKRLNALVDDLIDISRFENGSYELKMERISLNTMLDSVYHQYVKYCEAQNVELKREYIEDITFTADERRIKQVLYNFINNALNYGDKEMERIVLGVERISGKYRVYVYDNGIGIDSDKIEHIWERYYKADEEHKRQHLGSGIGLSLAKDLLDAHHFNYGVDSKKGEYSKFYFDVEKDSI